MTAKRRLLEETRYELVTFDFMDVFLTQSASPVYTEAAASSRRCRTAPCRTFPHSISTENATIVYDVLVPRFGSDAVFVGTVSHCCITE